MPSMTPKAVAEAYKGKYKPIVSSECPTCKKAGIANSVFYYCDSRRKDGKGRCMFCAYLAKPEKRQLTEAEFFQVDEHDFSFVHGMACRSCGDSRRIATEATANELGASLRGCLPCAITKAQNAATVRQARDFGKEVNRAYWKFVVDSVSRGKYVEIMTNDPYEIQQVKSLMRQCKLMNEYEKAGGSETRYELDHYVPVTGTAEIKGRTIADNLRIVIDTENRSKSDTMPTSYTAKQVISVRDLEAVNSWSEASKRLKRYLASDAIPETTIERIKATATALKADVDALAQRIGENAVKAILESHERNIKDFGFRSLESILEETKRHIKKHDGMLQAEIKRSLQKHRQNPYHRAVTAEEAYINKAGVFKVVGYTVSDIIDGERIVNERGATTEELRIIEAIKYHAACWAIEQLEKRGGHDIEAFTHPLLNVFGDKVFSLEAVAGKSYVTVWRGMKDKSNKLTDIPESGQIIRIMRADDPKVLQHLSEFEHKALEIQRHEAGIMEKVRETLAALNESFNRAEAVVMAANEICHQHGINTLNSLSLRFANDFLERGRPVMADADKSFQAMQMREAKTIWHGKAITYAEEATAEASTAEVY